MILSLKKVFTARGFSAKLGILQMAAPAANGLFRNGLKSALKTLWTYNYRTFRDQSFRAALRRRGIARQTSFRVLAKKYGLNPAAGLNNLLLKLSNFRMVVIGDSVLWGQGLRDEQKTFNIVGNFLRSKGNALNLKIDNYAHSGAILGNEDDRRKGDSRDGEVPCSYPTIFAQLDRSCLLTDSQTDLVILNGGINDVGFGLIINPLADITEVKLRRGIRESCGDAMRRLLLEVHGRYPNAKIIVTGYYNIISLQSGPRLYLALLSLFFTLPVIPEIALAPLSAAWLALSLGRSKTFFELSQNSLQNAVNTVNQAINNSATFITGDWTDDCALFTDHSRLFGFDFNPGKFSFRDANALNIVLEDDPAIANARLSSCMAQQGDSKCPIASIGHPNPTGAVHNADAIIETLAGLQVI